MEQPLFNFLILSLDKIYSHNAKFSCFSREDKKPQKWVEPNKECSIFQSYISSRTVMNAYIESYLIISYNNNNNNNIA